MRQDHYPLSSKYHADRVETRTSLIRPSDSHSAGMHALVLALVGEARQVMGVYRSDKSVRMLTHAVLAANLCLIFLHICLKLIAYFDFYRDQLYRRDLLITTEGGYPEMFNYLQLAVLG
jgi:hypothetical protein